MNRTVGLKRSAKPLKRVALKRTPFVSSQPRKPIPHESQKRREERPLRAAVRMAVAQRDKGRCRLLDLDSTHRCYGPSTLHHLRKASQGGAYSAENCVTICSTGNDLIEDQPSWAHSLGLVIRRGDAA